MARWSIASYNRFIGAARQERPGLSVAEARSLYTGMRERLDRPVFQTDIFNHPRIFKEEVQISEVTQAEEVSEEFFEEMPEDERIDFDEDEEWEVGGKADYAKKK